MSKKYYSMDPGKDNRTMKEKYGIDGWDIAKAGVGIVASGCATVMVHKYLKGVIPIGNSVPEKILTGVGIYFVSGMVGNKVESYVCSEMEFMKQTFKNAGDAVRKSKGEANDRSE